MESVEEEGRRRGVDIGRVQMGKGNERSVDWKKRRGRQGIDVGRVGLGSIARNSVRLYTPEVLGLEFFGPTSRSNFAPTDLKVGEVAVM